MSARVGYPWRRLGKLPSNGKKTVNKEVKTSGRAMPKLTKKS